MSIRKRLAFFIFVTTGLLVVIGGLLVVGGPVVVGAFRQSLSAMNSLDAIRELRLNVTRQRTALNRYLLFDDPQELLSFEESTRLARQNLDAIKARSGKDIPEWYADLDQMFNEARNLAKEVASNYKAGHKARAYDQVTSNLFPTFQKLFDRVNTLEMEKAAEAQAMFEKIRELVRNIESLVVIALIVAFLIGIALFRSLYRSVMKPLEILRRGTDEFGRGHWDYRIDWPEGNEFGALAKSFNTMAENVKQLQLQAVHMDRMSAVGQLAGGVAHEINNPLTAVLGQAQILMTKYAESDPVHGQIKKIEQAALRCKKIVRGLLDFSRPSQSTFEEIDVNSILSATLDLCEADLKRGRVTVEKRLMKTIPKIGGNPSELQQVLLNLINNAIQAMPRGGVLTFETRSHNDALTLTDRRKGAPNRKVPGPWVELAVRDTGVGIAKEHLARIGEPFFTTKEIGKGTGLGLAVSMGIVQKHGGILAADSAGINKGSAFIMTLPVNRNLIQQSTERAA